MKLKIKQVVQEFKSTYDEKIKWVYVIEITETERSNWEEIIVRDWDVFQKLTHCLNWSILEGHFTEKFNDELKRIFV